MLHEPEVAIVLRLGRPMRRIGMVGVAAPIGPDPLGRHALEGLVPVDRVVAPGFPRMEDCNEPVAMRVAERIKPAVPGIDLGQQCPHAQFGRVPVRRALIEAPHRKSRDGRLRDARGRHGPAGLPHVRTREIALA
jgi:hypothetical protein